MHGSSNSTRSSYDLTVPGKGEYSAMNIMARAGYDVWTMDHDGYGHSGSSGNSSDIASSVEDLKAAVPVVLKETGQQKMHMYGTSSGAIRAGAYAQAEPDRVDRLVLAAFTYKGSGAAEIQRRRNRIDELRANPRRKRDANMIRSIFTRDGHATGYDPEVPEAIVAAEMKFGDTIPAGTYVDMAVNLPLVDPAKVKSPVMMVRGEHDGNSTNEDLLDFYRQLPNGDRQFVILPARAQPGLQQEPASAVVRGEEFSRSTGADRCVIVRRLSCIGRRDACCLQRAPSASSWQSRRMRLRRISTPARP